MKRFVIYWTFLGLVIVAQAVDVVVRGSVSQMTWGTPSGNVRIASFSATTTTTTQPPAPPTYPIWDTVKNATSSNAPSPIGITGSSEYDAGYAPWRASDGLMVSRWQSGNGVNYPHWRIYDCGTGNSNILISFSFCPFTSQGLKNFTIDYSQDNSAWTTGATLTAYDSSWVMITNPVPVYARYFRIAGLTGFANNVTIWEAELSSCNLRSAIMSASNAPTGYIVIPDYQYDSNTYAGFRAFDGDITTRWSASGSTNMPHSIIFGFPSSVTINGFTIWNYQDYGVKNYRVVVSDDLTNWTMIHTGVLANVTTAQTVTNGNSVAGKYVKMICDADWTNGVSVTFFELDYKHYE